MTEVRELTASLRKPTGATREAIDLASTALGVTFPADYVAFMLESDGGEGRLGLGAYIALYPVGELLAKNKAYAVDEFAPGLVLFGSDGGGIAFAFDKRRVPAELVEVPFIPMSLDEVKVLGADLLTFLRSLARS
jgi:hypothetical protein